MGLAALVGLAGSVLGQGLSPQAPRLTIREVAAPLVEVQGGEVRLLPNASSPVGLAGDQINASSATAGSTAFLVWQDNAIDGDGLGIGSRVINLATGTASPQIHRVNQRALFDQQNPAVTTLTDGTAVVVWQSGKSGSQSIHARRLSRTGVPQGDEWVVAAAAPDASLRSPVVVDVPGRGYAIAWQSAGSDGVSSKIQVQSFDLAGKPTSDRRVVGTSALVDRSPALTAFANGDLAVAWVAEQASADVLNLGGQATRREANADIFAQVLLADGSAVSPVWVNGSAAPCDRPAVASLPSGRWVVGWSEFDLEGAGSWDIRAATLSASGVVLGSPVTLNDYRAHEQNGVRFASGPAGALAVWTTRGADGSGLGIASRGLDAVGRVAGDEILLNQTRRNDQFSPTVAPTPSGFRAVWSDFAGISTGVDLNARDLRTVSAEPRHKLKITWETVVGARYRLESSNDLVHWTEVQPEQTATSTQQSASIDAVAAAQTYFRVQTDR